MGNTSRAALPATNVATWWIADIAAAALLPHDISMRIVKDTLPSGVSYAVKPSTLEQALTATKIQTEVVLYQRRSGWMENKILFRADFYPAGRYFKNQDELLTITSRAVPSPFRASARAFIECTVFPDFIKWVSDLERLPVGSTVRREKQSFEREWNAPLDEDA